MTDLIEQKEMKLTHTKRSGATWFSWAWKRSEIPELKRALEEHYQVQIAPGDVDFIQPDESKDEVRAYFRASMMNKIAIAKKISTIPKLEKITSDVVIVSCRGLTPEGIEDTQFGMCDRGEPGRARVSMSALLGMAQTRARNRVIRSLIGAPNCSVEELDEEMQAKMHDVTKERLNPCPKCKERGWSQLQKRCLKCGITYEQILAEKEATEK